MTGNHLALVVAVKDRLVAGGQLFTTNEDAFAITGRIAWLLRDRGAQLIRKTPEKNGAWVTINGQRVKVSHDALNFPDGFVDLLEGGGPPQNRNVPSWQWTPGTHSPTDADAVAPFDLDAGVVAPVDPPPPPPPEEPPTQTELAVAVTLLAQEIKGLREDLGKLNDVLTLDAQTFGAQYTRIDAALTRIEDTQRRGLGGKVLGYGVRLVP